MTRYERLELYMKKVVLPLTGEFEYYHLRQAYLAGWDRLPRSAHKIRKKSKKSKNKRPKSR